MFVLPGGDEDSGALRNVGLAFRAEILAGLG